MAAPEDHLAISPAGSSGESESISSAPFPADSVGALAVRHERAFVFPVLGDMQDEALAKAAPKPVLLSEAAEEPQNSLRILLVEDHLDTCDILAAILHRRGFQVSVANNVAGALRLVATEAFDLLISDLGLPDATGYDLLSQAREIRSLPAIAMSGFGMSEDLERSRQAGFSDHLVKPIKVDQLVEAIRRVIRPR